MFFLIFEFLAFPTRKDTLLVSNKSNDTGDIIVSSSGSYGLYHDGKCHLTSPNSTLNDDEKEDWCSKIPENKEDKPFIQYSLKNKAMKITGFSLRSGCCWYACCCTEDGKRLDGYCCCRLYSFSLHASNDNKTWKIIHKVEKDENFYDCKTKTYSFDKTPAFRYVRLVLDEVPKGCYFCMQINQFQLYGETEQIGDFYSAEAEEESVSIIGRVSRNE